MARVDTTGNLQIYRIAPRASNNVGVDDENRLSPLGTCRDIDVEAAGMFHQVHRPNRTQWLGDGRANGSPVHEIAGMPDDDAGIRVERRERHVVVVAILQDGGVGMVAGNNGVEKGAVTQIGLSLTLNAPAPVSPPLTVSAMPALFLRLWLLRCGGLDGLDHSL